jgi:hypothetical protein
LAYDFNDDVPAVDGEQPAAAAPAAAATPPAAGPVESPAFTRFRTCRWQQPAEDGDTAFCTHREVKPYAGTIAFDADAWCGDCQHYKLRRVPKKRPREEDWAY